MQNPHKQFLDHDQLTAFARWQQHRGRRRILIQAFSSDGKAAGRQFIACTDANAFAAGVADYVNRWEQQVVTKGLYLTGVYYGTGNFPDSLSADFSVSHSKELVTHVDDLYLDLDPQDGDGPATDESKASMQTMHVAIVDYLLTRHSWPPPVSIDSGRGEHGHWRTQQDNTDEAATLRKTFLHALKRRFGENVDGSTHNANRLARLPGTWNRKGEPSEGRPHRPCVFLTPPPNEEQVVTPEMMQKVIDDISREFPPDGELPRDNLSGIDWTTQHDDGVRPGDEFNRTAAWRDILPSGWRVAYDSKGVTYWTRPGKTKGVSATTGHVPDREGNDKLHVFSDADEVAPFRGGENYTKLAAYALLHHNGDFSAAAKALWGEKQRKKSETPPDEPPQDPTPDDAGPFPSHLLAVPGLIGQVMAYNLRTANRRQPVLALAGAIALQATLAGRKVKDERNGRTNIYIVSVGESGSGKEHARTINADSLHPTNLEGPEDIASDSGLINNLSDRPCMLMQIDEFGKFFDALAKGRKVSPHLANIIKVLLQFYSCAGKVYRGKAYADIDRSIEIDQPNLVLHGTGTLRGFFDALTKESLEDGLLARLFVFEGNPDAPRERQRAEPVPAEIAEAVNWWQQFNPGGNLATIHPSPRLVETTSEANELLDDFAEHLDDMILGGTGWERSIWARAEEKACKLALIYACSRDRENPVIDMEAAKWAMEVSTYLTRRLIFLGAAHVAENDFDKLQKRVLDFARRQDGGFSGTTYATQFHYLDCDQRGKVLNNLVQTGSLIPREFEPEGNGKKKGTEWVLPTATETKPGMFRKPRRKQHPSNN